MTYTRDNTYLERVRALSRRTLRRGCGQTTIRRTCMARSTSKASTSAPANRRPPNALRDELPEDWVIFAGRKLPGENRDDVDLIVVGEVASSSSSRRRPGDRGSLCDDNYWYVNGDARPNPLNRIAQLARKVAGLLREQAMATATFEADGSFLAVILSHDHVAAFQRTRPRPEREHLATTMAARQLRHRSLAPSPAARRRPQRSPRLPGRHRPPQSGQRGSATTPSLERIEVPGLEQAYFAKSPDGQRSSSSATSATSSASWGPPPLPRTRNQSPQQARRDRTHLARPAVLRRRESTTSSSSRSSRPTRHAP